MRVFTFFASFDKFSVASGECSLAVNFKMIREMNYKSYPDKEILEILCEDNVLKKPFYFYYAYESDIIKKCQKSKEYR